MPELRLIKIKFSTASNIDRRNIELVNNIHEYKHEL